MAILFKTFEHFLAGKTGKTGNFVRSLVRNCYGSCWLLKLNLNLKLFLYHKTSFYEKF